MALNLDDLIMSDEDDVTPMKEPPLFTISKDIKRNSIEDGSSGSDSSYCEFAKESAKKMSSLIGEVQLAKIEKNERIASARKQKMKELEEKKNFYQRGKNFNKKDNTSTSGNKSSSRKSSNNKTVTSSNVQQFENDCNKSSSANSNQNLNKGSTKTVKDLNQQQNQSKPPPKSNSKNKEKIKTTSNFTSKFNNITIQDFGIDSTDSSDYESDNSSNNLSDNELLKSRAAAKLFTVKNLNESNFYFVDIDSSSDSDTGKKNVRHFQSFAKRMNASKRSKNINKKRINHKNIETEDTNESKNIGGNFFLKDDIIENQNKIISNDKTTNNKKKMISKDKSFESRNKTKVDQYPSTSKQIIPNQDGKIQSNFIPSTSKSLLQDLFEQTRQKNNDKSLRNTNVSQKYDHSIGQSNDKEVKNKNNSIKNEIEMHKNIERNTVKTNNQELYIKSKDSTKKNKKKKELRLADEVKNVGKTKESKPTEGVKKVEQRKETKSKVDKGKESNSKDEIKKVDQVKKLEKIKEKKRKAVEQKEIALSQINSQRIFNKNKFDSNEISIIDDDIVILSEIKLTQNKPEINKIDDPINITVKKDDMINFENKSEDSINIDNNIDDSITIDDLILDSYTFPSYHHNKTINQSDIADKFKINESETDSDIDFNTILNESKKKIENVIVTENKIDNNPEKNDPIVDSNLKFKSKDVLNESSSDFEAEFEASLQFNYRNKFNK